MARRGSRRISKPSKSSKVARAGKAQNGSQPKGLAEVEAAQQPTPEMLARAEFDYGPVKSEMGVQVGAAYRRRALYLTMAKKPGRFTWEELNAMRLYRSVFDRCERSPMACALSADSAGGRGIGATSFIHASPAVVEAKRKLAMIERGLGKALSIMRAVVLEDRSFSVIAIDRYGSRTRNWIVVDEPVLKNGVPVIENGKPVMRAVHREDVAPKSGRDRARVAKEFYAGLKLLVAAVERMTEAGVQEIWVHTREDGSAIIHRASLAPNGTFRMWGHPGVVEVVLNRLLERHHDRLTFPTPEAARDALMEAADGSLGQLEPDELAA